MKKMTKRIVTVLMAMLLFAICALPVAAVEQIQRDLKVGQTLNLAWSDTPYESSNTDVVAVEYNGGSQYTARAVGEGTAVITGGIWAGVEREYVITVTSVNTTSAQDNASNEIQDGFGDVFEKNWNRIDRTNDVMEVVLTILAVVLGVLLVGAIVYIFIEAPKSGMSRWWALMPLFSHAIGLIVFIVVRSGRKKEASSVNTFQCPTCSTVHPYGTAVCSVCGKKFY